MVPRMPRLTRWLTAAGCIALIAAPATQPASAATKQKQGGGPSLNVLLQLSLKPGLSGFVRQVSDPDSRHYRQYRSTNTLLRRFGSSKRSRVKTHAWAAAHHV